MITMLDVITIAYMGMIASILMSAVLILNWQIQTHHSGAALWASAYISSGIGLILIGFRSSIPHIVSIALANVFLDGFVCLVWIGMRRFVGKPSGGWWISIVMIIAHFCLNIHDVIIAPDVDSRIVSASVFHVIFFALCLIEMARSFSYIRKYNVSFIIMLIFVIHIVFNIIRIFSVAVEKAIDCRYTMLEGIAMGIVLACCFIIISNQILCQILKDKNKHIAETKKKLKESIYLYRDITSRIPCGVYTLRFDPSKNRSFEFLNKPMCDIFDIQKEKALDDAAGIHGRIHPDDRPGLEEADRLASQTLLPFQWEGRIIVRGEIRWIRVQSNALKLPENESLWNGIVIDITDEIKQRNILIKRASIDELTGLLSRRQFLEVGDQVLQDAKISGSSFIVVIVDIDFFKKINDTLGHSAGDFVLEEFGRLARNHFRSTDILGRLGGEEFGIILPKINDSEAINIVQQFRATIEGDTVSYQNNAIVFTISCGMCSSLFSEDSFQQLLNKADNALYKAKESGRNQVVVFS